MDPLQERLARIGLQVIGRRGFVLGGGHAIELHGMGTRPSEDIDLFSPERGSPDAVADDLPDAYLREGLAVTVRLRTADLVQMEVTGTQDQSCMVDLGVFWRHARPSCLRPAPCSILTTQSGGRWTHCSTGGLHEISWTWTRSWPAAGTHDSN
jgi:hypothetical protein